MTRGIVIGKFYPPHRGHRHLIDAALAGVDALTVIVCAERGEDPSATTRAAWIRELHPTADVVILDPHSDRARQAALSTTGRAQPDPAVDGLDHHDSALWARVTLDTLGWRPDRVFTSERYGEAYARLMESEHVLVDLDRSSIPISGTEVRRDPLAAWDFLEPPVRAHFARRIVVVGAESSGTTSLARALAERLDTCWVPEFGRLYWEGKNRGTSWDTDEFVFIATEQNRLEDYYARRCNRRLICDTDAFATAIWHERYVGRRSPEVEALARPHPLYLVTAPDIPFVQDGTRDGEHLREWMHDCFLEALTARDSPFAVVQGTLQERVAQALAAIEPPAP